MLNKKQIYFILAALCFLVYANSLNNAFVSDDIPEILKNPSISKALLYWLNPPKLLNSLNYLIGGSNPFIYHLTNITLHAIVTVLVFSFLSLFFKAGPSLLGACLFAVHPIHTEAVTWISGKNYLLFTLFLLATYLLYNKAGNIGGKFHSKYYIPSLIIFSYIIISYFVLFSIFLFLLILSDLIFKGWRKNWKLWIPFAVIVILRLVSAKGDISGRISFVAKEVGAASMASGNPVFTTVSNMAYSLYSHAVLLFWPARLTLYHEPAVISRLGLICILIALSVLLILLPFIFKKSKEIFFAICIFVLFLGPTYSPVMVAWLVAERYLYFPSIALCIIFAFLYEKYSAKAERLKNKKAPVLLFIFISIIAAYGVRTVARNEDWKTPERLWRQTVLVSPQSPRAHNNMGDAYAQEGNAEGTIREFKKAIELKPDYADAYHNLASTYHKQGDVKEAARLYKEAVRFNPELFESHFDLGMIYLNSGEAEAAIEHLKRAQELRPENSDVLAALNFAYEKLRD